MSGRAFMRAQAVASSLNRSPSVALANMAVRPMEELLVRRRTALATNSGPLSSPDVFRDAVFEEELREGVEHVVARHATRHADRLLVIVHAALQARGVIIIGASRDRAATCRQGWLPASSGM